MVAALLNGRERTGVVEEGMARRALYGRYIDRRVEATMETTLIKQTIERKVNERVKQEVEAIVARRLQEERDKAEQINGKPKPPIWLITQTVAEITGADYYAIMSPRRSRSVAWPRHFAIWLCRKLREELSLPTIGRAFKRDHTSTLYAIRHVEREIGQSPFMEWYADERIQKLIGDYR